MVAIEPRAEPVEILMKIKGSLRHKAEVDANRITIETSGDEVIRSSILRSWLERHEAELAAWSEPAGTKVEDRFVVAPPLACAFFAEPAQANLACDLDSGQRSLGLLYLSSPPDHLVEATLSPQQRDWSGSLSSSGDKHASTHSRRRDHNCGFQQHWYRRRPNGTRHRTGRLDTIAGADG
jgi:hypothetical protein